MFDILFLDLDDTILDFKKAERIAIAATIRGFGVEPTDEVLGRYHTINKHQWELLEKGEKTRAQILVDRFALLFAELGVTVDAEKCARQYEHNLSQGHWFLPGAEEAVKSLHKRFRLFLASNGTASVQHGRMTSAGLYPYFEQVFVSQKIGHNKPSRVYFESCLAQIEGFDKARCIMVGDSLSSDILGGINAGIATCWVAPPDKDCGDIRPDYRIGSIAQLEELLDTIKKEG